MSQLEPLQVQLGSCAGAACVKYVGLNHRDDRFDEDRPIDRSTERPKSSVALDSSDLSGTPSPHEIHQMMELLFYSHLVEDLLGVEPSPDRNRHLGFSTSPRGSSSRVTVIILSNRKLAKATNLAVTEHYVLPHRTTELHRAFAYVYNVTLRGRHLENTEPSTSVAGGKPIGE